MVSGVMKMIIHTLYPVYEHPSTLAFLLLAVE